MSELPFDRLVLDDGDGTTQELTLEQLRAIPLSRRVRLLLELRLRFFRGTEPVSTNVALQSLARNAAQR